MIKIDSFIVNKGSNSSSSSSNGGGFANTITVQKKLEKHKLWGQEFDGTQDVDGDMTVNGNINVSGNVKATKGEITTIDSTTINNSGNIVNGGNLKTTNATVDNDLTVTNNANVTNDLTVGNSANVGTVNATNGNITNIKSNNITNTDTIKTKNLQVTGTAHFFNLIIDKIKSAGGAALFTPADGFDVDIVQDEANEVKLLWQCQDEDGNQRDNMWKVNDQALCMSFNKAKVGTTHNVNNKYYWALVTSVNPVNEPTVIDGVKYNYITISKTVVDGVLNPEFGDSIVMCGYRGTDDDARQSAIYISAYSSLDKGLTAPLLAQYQGINDFNLESHRKSYYDANRAKFIGEFEATDGQNIIDIINNKIAESEASIKLDTKNIVLSVSANTKSISTVSKKVDDNKAATDKAIANTNNTITALTQTVKNNYSTLDQKADSISSRVSTNTKTINELSGKITSQATAISKIDQKADSISSTVQTINNNYASKSLLTQTSNNILAQVNNTYIKIGDDNITLGGNTTVKGSLTLTQTNQGFKLVGSEGITEIIPKSIGTYADFKSSNTNTQQVVKTINVNGAKSDSDDILRFQGSLIIYLGDRKKGDFIKCKFNSLTADVTNAWDGSSFSKNFALSSSFSAKVMNQYNSAVLHNWNTVYSNREYSYTFDSDTTNARIYVTFSGNTLYSSWIGNYNVYQGGKPIPMPNALAEVNCTLTLPTTAHILIGYDGWGANFGNNKTVYCGKDGFIASYGNNEFKITDAGISHNNMATTYTIIGTSSSSIPTTYTVQDPIDTVLCKSGYCKVIFPSNPYNGQRIKIYDKSPAESYINSNGKYVCSADRRYSDRSIWTNQNLSNMVVRIYTYINDTWFEEYTG